MGHQMGTLWTSIGYWALSIGVVFDSAQPWVFVVLLRGSVLDAGGWAGGWVGGWHERTTKTLDPCNNQKQPSPERDAQNGGIDDRTDRSETRIEN
jgi:hypothetical protein